MRDRVPHFVGIGAHKAGTSWLHWQLSSHPAVWMPPVKELHYFDRGAEYPSPSDLSIASPLRRYFAGPGHRARFREGCWSLRNALARRDRSALSWSWQWYFGVYGDAWYRKLFERCANGRLCGEITPAYSMLEHEDIAALRRINPDVRIIFMLRNPIDRAWSAVRFDRDRGYSGTDLESADQIISTLRSRGNVLRGDYLRTLAHYLDVFRPEQVMVGFFDAIAADPAGLIRGLSDFLGLPARDAEIDNATRVNASPWRQLPTPVQDFLIETYGDDMAVLAQRLGSYAANWARELGREDVLPATSLPPVVQLS